MSAYFCIARFVKLSTYGAISSSAAHNFRTMEVPNIDPSRTHLNKTVGPSTPEELRKVAKKELDKLKKKPRSNAVLLLEYLITFTAEWQDVVAQDRQLEYLRDGVEWVRKRHGAENVICENLQLDEKAPHMVVYVIPRTPDGRLCAREFTGGPATCSKFQTDFWKDVGRKYGLLRGVEGSKAHHTTAKQYTAALAANPTLLAPAFPDITKLDWAIGKAKVKLGQYAADLASYATLVEQHKNVAAFRDKARINQNKGIAKLQAKVTKLEGAEARAQQLAEENRAMTERIAAQEKAAERAKTTIARLSQELAIPTPRESISDQECESDGEQAPGSR